jgi:hypothetical protein
MYNIFILFSYLYANIKAKMYKCRATSGQPHTSMKVMSLKIDTEGVHKMLVINRQTYCDVNVPPLDSLTVAFYIFGEIEFDFGRCNYFNRPLFPPTRLIDFSLFANVEINSFY